MSEVSRRDVLRRVGLALVATGLVDRVAGGEVHGLVRDSQVEGSPSTLRAFTADEFRTLERLTDLIIPVEDGRPGAVAAGAARWIDLIVSENDQLRKIYKDGFRWLDAAIAERGAADFAAATSVQQKALLDVIAYRRNETPAVAPGIAFFSWVRRMTVDAFYTSEIGIRDIDYRGSAHVATFVTPAESIAYALERSKL
jgi:gluconate 2-dehydrogenase gamma chain